jgi:hypothetical protein
MQLDLTNILFLLLGLIFFYIAARTHRRLAKSSTRPSSLPPSLSPSLPRASFTSWGSIHNLAAIFGIASFVIQILQWVKLI